MMGLVDYTAPVATQRAQLVAMLRAYATLFRQVDGHNARGFPADMLAHECETMSDADIRRVGPRLQSITEGWLLDVDTVRA